MGYTHYFTKKAAIPAKEWHAIATRAKRIIEVTTVPLAFEYDEPEEKPVADASQIRFNGVGNDGHETFLLTPDGPEQSKGKYDEGGGFAFCKTARKPYDLAVCAVLLVVNKFAGKIVEVASDGTRDEWADAKAFAERVLGEELPYPPEVRPGREEPRPMLTSAPAPQQITGEAR